ncbi:MAG: hypothetical protein IJD59_05725 [Clostridia bacterium]|nr:hypothetical protein [Clostridia bacterium]
MVFRLEDVLKIVSNPFVCTVDGEPVGANKDEYKNYIVTAIGAKDGAVIVEIKPWKPTSARLDADWCRERTKKVGEEPGFF